MSTDKTFSDRDNQLDYSWTALPVFTDAIFLSWAVSSAALCHLDQLKIITRPSYHVNTKSHEADHKNPISTLCETYTEG